jgi:chemotaxis protein MotB
MAQKPKPKVQEEESGEGAPLWIISFADMMSLLMAFFVMLSTFSSFGPAESAKLHKAVKAALMSDYFGGWFRSQPRGAMGPQALAAGQLEKGSEKPTLEEKHRGGLLAETEPLDFRTRRIFAVESKSVFWAAGTALSSSGRDFLDNLAAFLRSVPDRIIVSESGPVRPKAVDGGQDASSSNPPAEDPELGLRRAVAVVKYLTRRGILKDRFSIGMEGMRPDAAETGPAEENRAGARILEIVLLDESAYR